MPRAATAVDAKMIYLASTFPINFTPMVQFDRPVNPASLGGVTLTCGGVAVSATPVLSSGGTVLSLVPTSVLSPNTACLFTIAGVQDAAGSAQSGAVSRSFTTGSSIDLTIPTVTAVNPIQNSTAGRNPVVQMAFNKALNPIQSGSFTFYNAITGRGVYGAALSWASDFRSATLTYPGSLDPSSSYYWYLNDLYDLAGNAAGSSYGFFYTGSSVDTTAESVVSVSPADHQVGAPLNALISLRLAKPASPLTVNSSSVILTPAVNGAAVQLSSDGMTITVALGSTLLTANQTYLISVAAGLGPSPPLLLEKLNSSSCRCFLKFCNRT